MHEQRRHRPRCLRRNPGKAMSRKAQATGLATGLDHPPLGIGKIGAGRVVAAGVQNDDGTGAMAIEALLHAGKFTPRVAAS